MPRFVVRVLFVWIVVCQTGAWSAPIKQEEVDYQNEIFKHYWEVDLVWRLDDLPQEGKVPDFRIPYSGHDYPDKAGGTHKVVSGTASPLAKYDQAFNRGRYLAVGFEKEDVKESEAAPTTRVGLFGRRRPVLFPRLREPEAPGWYGHCNGWTAASIRHPEPQYSVKKNGVIFTPADIKALLAEVYMYADTEFLGGVDHAIHPATLHVVLSNWLGRGDHPVGMESALGEVVYNYPIYAYESTVTDRSDRQKEVKLDVTYAYNSKREVHKSPRVAKAMQFHYLLDLDEKGDIVGGSYFKDSRQIDMLWVPLNPPQGGREGNERGNPYIDVKEVMAIWKTSVPEDLREKWLNIDPTFPKE